ncbi:MAG: choline dehydrogenase [Porticoccaceae bacterium]|mgnify:CR=1 FL=1|jgi:choline dehydrogenase|nr:choline dehydrogenase [Porticoccaceae bacterium]MBT5577350.1 choline dehydrogenase [Porticoccaceae bacterium]MBT7375186.1 choline dehydrogenase [Porticoccaceae bacterium]
MKNAKSYDYIVVGAGSAGTIVAARLSENPDCKVLLVEYGGTDASVFIRMPSALGIPMNSRRYNWGFESIPEPYLNNRRMNCPRGKVMGGTSSINGMVYVRGNAKDFDEWESLGAEGWNYQNCLPYFKKFENHQLRNSEYTGSKGPVAISGGNNMRNPLYRAFIDAGVEAGYGETEDYNGYRQEGFGQKYMNVDAGVRASTSYAYLKKVKKRPNLQIRKRSLVQRVIFEGKTAIGIQCTRAGRSHYYRAEREVILCAGAIGSPHLLQVSGVGPKKTLQAAGIEQLLELPGVGKNLQDHLEFNFQYTCKQPISLNGDLGLISKALIGACWLFFKTGLGRTNHFESCAFIRSRAGVKWPDIQYHFLPGAITYDGSVAFKGHGFQVHVGHNKPTSRGHVRALSADINQHPEILFNYLATEEDRQGFRDCVRLTREIMAQPAMDAFRGEVIQPGPEIETDEQIDAFVRRSVDSAYHPAGTCKIGTDKMAVVDSDLRVHGLYNIRVIDSSVFPTVPNGNLNAPTMMVAERGADLIKGEGLLPAAGVAVYEDAHWEIRQRELPAEQPG